MKRAGSGPQKPGMISRKRVVLVLLALLYSLVHLIMSIIALKGSTGWVLKAILFLVANMAWILFVADVLSSIAPSNWVQRATLTLYAPVDYAPVVAVIDWNGRIYAEIAEWQGDDWYVCDRQSGKFDRTRKVVGDVIAWSLLPPSVKFT